MFARKKTKRIRPVQKRSQDFLWGGRGGAYLNNGDHIINILNDTLR